MHTPVATPKPWHFRYLIATLLIIVGLWLRFYALDKKDAWSPILSELGTFFAGIIAVTIIYEVTFKRYEEIENRNTIKLLIKETFKDLYGNSLFSSEILENGRMSVEEKIEFMQKSKKEIISIGLAQKSFVSYFRNRPRDKFWNKILEMMQRGVNLKIYFYSPSSLELDMHARSMNETNLRSDIESSIKKMREIRDDLNAQSTNGKIEIYSYDCAPTFHALILDKSEASGTIQISHYLHNLAKADAPVLIIKHEDRRALYGKYSIHIDKVISSSSIVI